MSFKCINDECMNIGMGRTCNYCRSKAKLRVARIRGIKARIIITNTFLEHEVHDPDNEYVLHRRLTLWTERAKRAMTKREWEGT